MEWNPILLAPRRERMIAQGYWHDRTINDYLDTCLEQVPDKVALTACQIESGARTTFTYREMARMADRIAVGLHRLGVRRNDVVACQLPNWWPVHASGPS
jgi:cyclohexanecarboxylate-CoA ligase